MGLREYHINKFYIFATSFIDFCIINKNKL